MQADLNEHSLFSVEGEGAEATIRVNNHSRLGLIIAEAFVKDHLFVLKKGKVVLKPRIEEPERVSEKMFNAIRDIAVPYYSELDSIKSLETEATSSKVGILKFSQHNCNKVTRIVYEGKLTYWIIDSVHINVPLH